MVPAKMFTCLKYRHVLSSLLAFITGVLVTSMMLNGSHQTRILSQVYNQLIEDPWLFQRMGIPADKEDTLGPHPFQDSHKHHDDEKVAQDLYNKVRVLCWVMTCEENHRKKADHVMATWGKRCNKVLFVSDGEDTSLPVIHLKNIEKGRNHLTKKTMLAFQYLYDHYYKEADWFLKTDDDSYVIVENLRYFLSAQNTSEPIYFGHHFKTNVKQGYFSGGGGYVISRESLRRFGERKGSVQCKLDGGAEDTQFGRCMEKLGVKTGDSRDVLGRSRFHCFAPGAFINGQLPGWYYNYDKYGGQKGIHSVSDYPITFHYISPNRMYELEFFTYHLQTYGIHPADQDLNGSPPDHLITEDSNQKINITNSQIYKILSVNKTGENKIM